MSYIGNTNTTQAFTPAVDFFSGNASTTAFTLSRPVASVAQVQAVISNVPQDPGSAYTVSGNTITFTSAPPSGTNNIYVYYTSPITQVIAPGQGTVTSNSFASGASEFAAGTVLLFQQTSAPTGWTKSTTHNDKALRVVSGSASSGGSVAFTTAFASQAVAGTVGTSGATTLSTGQIPSHTHTAPTVVLWGAAVTGTPNLFCGTTTAANSGTPTSAYYGPNTGAAGGGGSHDHSGGTFTGTAINLAVQYVDVIIATKD
jgi:hypothetical protein